MGRGDVHLVLRNRGLIAAFWYLEVTQPMQPFRFAYTLYWTRKGQKLSENKVFATHRGLAQFERRQIVIDFAPGLPFPENNPPPLSPIAAIMPPSSRTRCFRIRWTTVKA
jgi:hypothetical protein